MTHDVEPIDEAVLAQLVRDVADDWHLPPQRLNAPTWHDRVRARGLGSGRRHGWLGRLSGAGALAIALTVGLSLAAVWISGPSRRTGIAGVSPTPGGSTQASGSATAGTTPGPSASTLSKLSLSGELPSPASVLVRTGGGFAIADLTTGTLGSPLDGASALSSVRRLANGTYVCLCVTTDGDVNGTPTHEVVQLRTYDAKGNALRVRPIADYTGRPDPRPAVSQDQPPHVDVAVTYSPDGAFGYVGWSLRQPPTWKSGVVRVDLMSGETVQEFGLADGSTGPSDAPVNILAPRLSFSVDGMTALVSRSNYAVDRASGAYSSGADHYLLAVAGRVGAKPVAFAQGRSCPDGEADAGLTDGGIAWFVCWSNSGGLLTVRRVAADGTLLGDRQVNATGEGGSWTVAGTAIYFWTPVSRTVTRVDLVDGTSSSASAPAPTASAGSGSGPLGAIGRWLAPSATAKIFLDPGIVVSTGPRPVLYALGIGVGDAAHAGSTGVFAFDPGTLAPLAHWAPTADFVSLAVSADGRFVYAAGAPGVDADGLPAPFRASITVYDSSDGSVRLVAGELEHDDLLFTSPHLP